MPSQIVIVGFMGSGKSTVARALGSRLGYDVVDLDGLITEQAGRSPAKIIEVDGEGKFRELETRALREVLREETPRVIALGGGAWTIAENRKLIAECGACSVWLDAPFDLCWKRIEEAHEPRPLAPSREVAEKLFNERRSAYKLADVEIAIDQDDPPDQIVLKIINEVKLS